MSMIKENTKKKEYLMRYGETVKMVKILDQEIEQLREEKMRPSTIRLDGMPKGSGQKDLSDYMVRLDALIEDLKRARYKRILIYKDISDSIENMEDEREKNVLRVRYIHLKTWEEVCREMNYEWTWIHKLHNRALMNLNIENSLE